MALAIYYEDSGSYVEVSSGNDTSVPVVTTHDGKNGDTKTVCLFLRNDDATKWYSHITVYPEDTITSIGYNDVIYTETGWGIKLNKGGVEPTTAGWNNTDWGAEISMDDIGSDSAGDSTAYYPFYYLITCPPNSTAQNKTDLVLKVEYVENAVS